MKPIRATFNWIYNSEERANSDDQSKIPPFHIRNMDDDQIDDWHYMNYDDAFKVAKSYLDEYPDGVQICNGFSNTVEHIVYMEVLKGKDDD
jgi:hypothetical protein